MAQLILFLILGGPHKTKWQTEDLTVHRGHSSLQANTVRELPEEKDW